jgi:hypothetical protein
VFSSWWMQSQWIHQKIKKSGERLLPCIMQIDEPLEQRKQRDFIEDPIYIFTQERTRRHGCIPKHAQFKVLNHTFKKEGGWHISPESQLEQKEQLWSYINSLLKRQQLSSPEGARLA